MGHSDIAPLRKIDPGEKFPWKILSKFKIGKWYTKNNKVLRKNTKKIRNVFFKNLNRIGYRYFNAQKKSINDKKIIRSFQQHYLPNNVTGRLDQKTYIISQYLAN